MSLRFPVIIFHHNNKKEGKSTATASEVKGFPNHPASFPNLWNSMNVNRLDLQKSKKSLLYDTRHLKKTQGYTWT